MLVFCENVMSTETFTLCLANTGGATQSVLMVNLLVFVIFLICFCCVLPRAQ